MIRGIGPVYAGKMVRAFGEKVFDIIEVEPERLREVTVSGTEPQGRRLHHPPSTRGIGTRGQESGHGHAPLPHP